MHSDQPDKRLQASTCIRFMVHLRLDQMLLVGTLKSSCPAFIVYSRQPSSP